MKRFVILQKQLCTCSELERSSASENWRSLTRDTKLFKLCVRATRDFMSSMRENLQNCSSQLSLCWAFQNSEDFFRVSNILSVEQAASLIVTQALSFCWNCCRTCCHKLMQNMVMSLDRPGSLRQPQPRDLSFASKRVRFDTRTLLQLLNAWNVWLMIWTHDSWNA